MGFSFRERFSGVRALRPDRLSRRSSRSAVRLRHEAGLVRFRERRGGTPFPRRGGASPLKPFAESMVAACESSGFTRYSPCGKDISFFWIRARSWGFRDVFPSFSEDPAFGERFGTERAVSKGVDTICFYDMEFIHPQYGVSRYLQKPESSAPRLLPVSRLLSPLSVFLLGQLPFFPFPFPFH